MFFTIHIGSLLIGLIVGFIAGFALYGAIALDDRWGKGFYEGFNASTGGRLSEDWKDKKQSMS
jgi:hypothetical protein